MALGNQLAGHPSPYLAMHAEDPVHWQDWGEPALARARAENKLLFISSGYFACHWCHIMQKESYRNREIATLLNRHFVPVKVDRELNPALDAHLIEFVQRTRGTAGWPLNVFLTPEGHPLLGMTYVRPDRFRQTLEILRTAWDEDREQLRSAARDAALEMASLTEKEPTGQIAAPEEVRSRLIAQALAAGDDLEGGFGDQTRFPMAPQLHAFLDILASGPDPRLHRLVELTLDQMATQGMRDHLRGGFFRYTEDPGWQVPHYEKMLYTNAQLVGLYLHAAEALRRPDYRLVARDTMDFALRELRQSNGGFIASLSAVDTGGVEGGCYLWQSQELELLLDPDELAAARLRWRLHGTPVTEGGYLPVLAQKNKRIAAELGLPAERIAGLLSGARRKLVQARAGCEMPRDDKQLAAWNGLMLSALAAAAETFGDPSYRRAGLALRDFLRSTLWTGERLMRARRGKEPVGTAALEDYAYVAAGLRSWAKLTGSEEDLALAGRLTEQAWRRFYVDGVWRNSDELTLPGQVRERALADGTMPSPAAILIELSLALAEELRLPELKEKAQRALAEGRATVAAAPFWHASEVRVLLGAQGR